MSEEFFYSPLRVYPSHPHQIFCVKIFVIEVYPIHDGKKFSNYSLILYILSRLIFSLYPKILLRQIFFFVKYYKDKILIPQKN